MNCLVLQAVSCFKDLFIAPTFDELEQVARDAKGSPRKLSMRQLRSIRENGSVDAMCISCNHLISKMLINVDLWTPNDLGHESAFVLLVSTPTFTISLLSPEG